MMENDNNEVESKFKESFDNFESDVQPKVWKNVKTAIKWGSAGLLIKLFINKVGTNAAVAFVSSVITVIGTLWVMDWNKPADKKQPENSKTEIAPTMPTVQKSEVTVVEYYNEKETVKEIPKNRKNAETEHVTNQEKTEVKNIKSLIKRVSGKSISIISASPVSGPAPLVVNLSNIGTGTKNYQWTFSDGQAASNISNPPCVFLTPGVHTITLKSESADGKIGVDSIQVTVTGNSSVSPSGLTSFSPDGDGVADVFNFKCKNIANMKVEIYDKNSNLVYKWNGIDGKWDGITLKGEHAPQGNYFYILNSEGIDGKKFKLEGVIQLSRKSN